MEATNSQRIQVMKKLGMDMKAIIKMLEAVDKTACVVVTEDKLDKPGPRIVYVNKNWEEETGYSFEEAFGKTPRILQGPSTDRAILDLLKATLKRGEVFANHQTINYKKDRTPFRMAWTAISHIGNYYVCFQKCVPNEEEAYKYLSEMGAPHRAVMCQIDDIIMEIPAWG